MLSGRLAWPHSAAAGILLAAYRSHAAGHADHRSHHGTEVDLADTRIKAGVPRRCGRGSDHPPDGGSSITHSSRAPTLPR